MCVIAERPVYINNFREGGHIHQWNRWLTSDDKTDDCNTILRITAIALLALTVIGFLFAFAVCALMDWYEERQAIVAFNEEINKAFGTSDPLTILSRLQSEKDTLDPSILELGLHAILPSSSVSFKEKFILAKEAERIFETKNYKEQREFFIPIIVCKESVEVPLSLLETSSIIRDMQLLDDEDKPYFEETPTLIDTRHFSLKDFKNYLPLISKKRTFSFNDLSSWLKTISIAHYLNCDDEMMKKLADACPHFDNITIRGMQNVGEDPITCKEVTINHIRKILECNLEAETIAEVVAPLVADYILVERNENYRSISEILQKLTSLPGFVELAKYLPIEIELPHRDINQENLDELIALFPRVKGLNLQNLIEDDTLTIPTHVIPNLRKLELIGHFSIIWPNVDSLPRLEVLMLDRNPGLNIRCPNLKKAGITLNRLTGVRPPQDFFDNLAYLETLYLNDWDGQNVLRAPLNCPNLREINLVGFNLDFSPLSNHQLIESIHGMYFTNFTGIDPNACPRLRHYRVAAH